MVGQGVVRFPDGTLAFHPSRGNPSRKATAVKATLRCFTLALDVDPVAVHNFDGPPKVVAEQLWLTLKAFDGRAIETDFEADSEAERDEFNAAYTALVPDDCHADPGWAGSDVTQ
jgi:hypothetical protein